MFGNTGDAASECSQMPSADATAGFGLTHVLSSKLKVSAVFRLSESLSEAPEKLSHAENQP